MVTISKARNAGDKEGKIMAEFIIVAIELPAVYQWNSSERLALVRNNRKKKTPQLQCIRTSFYFPKPQNKYKDKRTSYRTPCTLTFQSRQAKECISHNLVPRPRLLIASIPQRSGAPRCVRGQRKTHSIQTEAAVISMPEINLVPRVSSSPPRSPRRDPGVVPDMRSPLLEPAGISLPGRSIVLTRKAKL